MEPCKLRPKRPALKWHGGKWRLAKWILSHIPDHHDVYAEPFGGSAAVLLQKPRSRIEVYNDLDQDIFNFFTILREHSPGLIQSIQLTPFHELEYLATHPYHESSIIGIEAARRFYIRSFMSIMGPTAQWQNGFRRQKVFSRGKAGNKSMKPAAISFAETSHLWVIADRLRGVFYEHMDALSLMKTYDHPETIMYMDPPYLLSTRRQQAPAYQHELMTDDEHLTFLEVAKGLQSMSLISGYDSALYREHLEQKGWHKFTKSSRTNGKNKRIETLWGNPQLVNRLFF